MHPDELDEIETRASVDDIPRLVAEVRKLQTLIGLVENIEDARLEEEIADELRWKKHAETKKAEKALRETLHNLLGRPVVKTERERRAEAAEGILRKHEVEVDDERDLLS